MKKLDSATVKSLRKQFPFLGDILSSFDREFADFGYKGFSFSIFDHWLSNEEASSEIDFTEPIHTARNNKRFPVFLELANDSYVFHCNNRYGYRFMSFESDQERFDYCKRSVYDEDRVCLCLPELDVVLLGGFDYTDHIFYRDENEHLGGIKGLIERFFGNPNAGILGSEAWNDPSGSAACPRH